MLQGRFCRRWVNHEFECHKVVVNATDKLRPCSSNTINDSNCLVSVSVSVGNGSATATITAGTPTTCDNTDNTDLVGSYDTVAAVAVSTASDDCDNGGGGGGGGRKAQVAITERTIEFER